MEPLVSVIIPSYNYGNLISETIKNVLAQSYTNIEIIVIDDGSLDNTASVVSELIESDNRINYFYQENKGLSAARNLGIKCAKGDFCLFLDADDLISPDKIKLHVEHFDQQPHIDISYSRFWYFKNNIEERFSTLNLETSEWMKVLDGDYKNVFPAFLTSNNMVVHSAVVRKSLIDKTGFFNTDMKSLEDWDYWLRCLYNGAYISFLNNEQAYVLTRVHSISMSTNRSKMHYYEYLLRSNIEDKVYLEYLNEKFYPKYMEVTKPLVKKIYKYRILRNGFFNINDLKIIANRIGVPKLIQVYFSAFNEWIKHPKALMTRS
ncbi:glycosyltransferase family 2 protein [Solitalea longa]|nr:glycosyltransferase [Solitalea longa]